MLWNTYDFGTLFPATAAIFFITALVSFRVTGSVAGALAASLIKAGLFLFYFSVLFDEAYVLRDDQTYIRMARALAAKDVGVFNWWHHIPLLFASAGGPHFGYYIHNI
ncbi:MAG TPA: hypothetical protein VM165_13260, partial [Planctomycetaceae bacterium]|nr:hypothetical protein [Planctomycetaceae bacterium]